MKAMNLVLIQNVKPLNLTITSNSYNNVFHSFKEFLKRKTCRYLLQGNGLLYKTFVMIIITMMSF